MAKAPKVSGIIEQRRRRGDTNRQRRDIISPMMVSMMMMMMRVDSRGGRRGKTHFILSEPSTLAGRGLVPAQKIGLRTKRSC